MHLKSTQMYVSLKILFKGLYSNCICQDFYRLSYFTERHVFVFWTCKGAHCVAKEILGEFRVLCWDAICITSLRPTGLYTVGSIIISILQMKNLKPRQVTFSRSNESNGVRTKFVWSVKSTKAGIISISTAHFTYIQNLNSLNGPFYGLSDNWTRKWGKNTQE